MRCECWSVHECAPDTLSPELAGYCDVRSVYNPGDRMRRALVGLLVLLASVTAGSALSASPNVAMFLPELCLHVIRE